MTRYWLIDSNVLVYALNKSDKHHLDSQALLERAATGKLEACIAQQNILEFIATVTSIRRVERPVSIETAQKAINQYSSFLRIITPRDETIWDFLSILKEVPATRERIFDVYLAATALSNGVSQICTWNVRHLEKIPHLKVRTPTQILSST
jgi:predicted nucleic acid-binding protein